MLADFWDTKPEDGCLRNLKMYLSWTPQQSVLYRSIVLFIVRIDIDTKVTHIKIVKRIKLKVSLQQATKAQRGSRFIALLFPSTSALDGGGWSTPRPGRFAPGKAPVLIIQVW